jgi:serine/threonine-protein kinase
MLGEGRRIGQRYELFGVIAAGGTATVHLGRVHGTGGFVKPIAIKRLHPHLAADPQLRSILVDEARLVSRISHPNVVAVLDIVEDDGELFLILEYVHGVTLSSLLAAGGRCSPDAAIAVMKDALTGLHAAHHARDAAGANLGLVHRDVSPRNIIVTSDGITKILDFGIAKAHMRRSATRDGYVRGSLPYMAPEQLEGEPLSARTDVYGASAVLWELLTGVPLFDAETDAAIGRQILDHDVRAPSTLARELPRSLDAVVLRGLSRDPAERFASGLEMALALEASVAPARHEVVAAWVARAAAGDLAERQARLDASPNIEPAPAVVPAPASPSRSRRATAIAAIAMATVAVAATTLAGRRPTERRDTPPLASLVTSAPATIALAAPSAAVSSTVSMLPPELPRAPASVTTPSHAPRSVAASSAPRSGAASSAPVPAVPSIARSGNRTGDCPPYFVDATGVRRFNRECIE